MADLKPCPFCGSREVELDYRVTRNRRYGKLVMIVMCKCLVCHASAKPFGYTDADENIAEERAIRAWNMRNQQDSVMDQLIRMYEAVELAERGCEDAKMANEKRLIEASGLLEQVVRIQASEQSHEKKVGQIIMAIANVPVVDAVTIPDCGECAFNSGITYWHQCENCLGQATNNFLAEEAITDGKEEV